LTDGLDLAETASVILRGAVDPAVDEATVRAAVAAVVSAGELHLDLLGQIPPAEVGRKSSRRDLVTAADVGAERLVVERLRALGDGAAIEAEEETSDEVADGLRWFLDPLDGTVNFVHGIPMFSVSLALYRGPEPLFGVVHAPRLGETFVAARGAGCWLLETPGGPSRLSVSATSELSESILATGFPYRRGELANSNLENFGRFFNDVRGLRRLGSAALDLAYVAAGRLDGFWELHLSPFDVAAGALLVREAGGVVEDFRGGGRWLRGGEILACAPGLRAPMASRLQG
jgi:myo-inositol-1(or 4)-monophosphatase